MREMFLAWFGAIILLFALRLFALVKGAIDMLSGIEDAQETLPWLKHWAQTEKWRGVVLLATCFFYGGREMSRCCRPFIRSRYEHGFI